MFKRVKNLASVVLLYVVVSFSSNSMASSSSENYIGLFEQIPSLPLILFDVSGETVNVQIDELGNIALSDRPIVSSMSGSRALPGSTIFKPFEGRPGVYLLEYILEGKPVYRLATLSEESLNLGSVNDHPLVQGSLLTLPNGVVGLYAQASNGTTYIHTSIANIVGDDLHRVATSPPQILPGNWEKLGPVVHPNGQEVGFAFFMPSEGSRIKLLFPRSTDVEITVEPGIQIFAAGDDSLVLGYFDSDCVSASGFPSGLCTPVLKRSAIPSRDMRIGLSDMAKLDDVAEPTPGWTFGSNHRVYEPSDFRIVGNRVYVISYRGMVQSLIYYSLDEEKSYTVVIQPEEGIDLSFLQVAGSKDTPMLLLRRTSLLGETSVLEVDKEGGVRTILAGAVPKSFLDLNLAVKTFDRNVSQGIPPFVIVGKSEVLSGDFCRSGRAVVEVYGGSKRPMRAESPLGLVPDLLSNDGIYVMASIPGSGGYGVPWSRLGVFGNSGNQTKSVRDIVQLLRNTGCKDVVVTGFSHGGTVAVNAALQYPATVDSVVIGSAALDLEREYEKNNQAISAFLPIGTDSVESASQLSQNLEHVWNSLSPVRLARTAGNLTGSHFTIMYGLDDRTFSTYAPDSLVDDIRSKGGRVDVFAREGVGHTKFANAQQWAEYYSILGSAINRRSQER